MKVLGIVVDSELNWNSQVDKMISRCRSYLYPLRYLRRHLSLNEIAIIIQAHVTSHLTYCSPVWYHGLNFKQREKIKSIYYKILRVLVRDFSFRLNRTGLLKKTNLEDIGVIYTKRSSVFLFKIIQTLEPTNLACFLLSKCYENERSLGKLSFFDTSQNRIGKKAFSNSARETVSKWRFDWMGMTIEAFKERLHAQFERRV